MYNELKELLTLTFKDDNRMVKKEHGYFIKKYKGINLYCKTIEGLNKAIKQHEIFLQYIAEGKEDEYYKRYPLREA